MADKVTPATPFDAEAFADWATTGGYAEKANRRINELEDALREIESISNDNTATMIARSVLADELVPNLNIATPLDAEAFVRRLYVHLAGPIWETADRDDIKAFAAELSPHLSTAGDDGEVVTEEWLNDIGWELRGITVFPPGSNDHDVFWDLEEKHLVVDGLNGWTRTKPTRGQLLYLLSALGFGAKEKS